MWTLISSVNLRAARQRLTRAVVTTAVVLGTATHIAMVLLPASLANGSDIGPGATTDSQADTMTEVLRGHAS
jgi:hypothetical protein